MTRVLPMAYAFLASGCMPALPDAGADREVEPGVSAPSGGGCGTGSWRPGWLEIHHIDAGEAVSTLIVSPAGRSLLIDVGEAAWDESAGALAIGDYVRAVLGCASLDYVVLSHFHLDHVGAPGRGGLWHLRHVQGFAIGKLLHRDLFRFAGAGGATLSAWRSYLASDEARSLRPEVATAAAAQVDLGPGVLFAFVAGDGAGCLAEGDFSADPAPPDENDYSLVALLRMGRLDYVTAGDLSGENRAAAGDGYSYHDLETEVAARVKDVDVYRVSHHGSSHSSNSTWLAELAPRVAIVQVADGNPHEHPAQETIDRLLARAAVYLTERGAAATALGASTVVGHVVLRTATGLDFTVDGDAFVARDPVRADADGDGYFAEVDPDDGAPNVGPAPRGGRDPLYQACR